jgi:hypothetical protein
MNVGTLGAGPGLGSCAQSVKTQPGVARKIQFTAVNVVLYAKRVERSTMKTETKLEFQTSRDFFHNWHVAINGCVKEHGFEGNEVLYEAKSAAAELPRIAYIFGKERRGELSAVHQQCSHTAPVPIAENYLMCCLGKRCGECPMLKGIEQMKGTDAEKDLAKAFTCVAHIISEGGDPANEGYIMDLGDRMFWTNMYSNMADGPSDQGDSGEVGYVVE